MRSRPTGVVLVICGGKANLALVRLVVEENRADRLLVMDEVLLMNAKCPKLQVYRSKGQPRKDNFDRNGNR